MKARLEAGNPEAVPDDVYVSFKIGSFHKQSRFVTSRTHTFPEDACKEDFAKVDIFQRVGYATLNLDKSDLNEQINVDIPCSIPNCPKLTYQVYLERSVTSALTTEERDHKRQQQIDGTNRYMVEHRLQESLAEIVGDLLNRKPQEPFSYLSKRAMERSRSTPNVSRPGSRPTSATSDTGMRKRPEGALPAINPAELSRAAQEQEMRAKTMEMEMEMRDERGAKAFAPPPPRPGSGFKKSHRVVPIGNGMQRSRLLVTIVSASGLRAADFGGKSDPYCSCQISGRAQSQFKTQVINKTLNPAWNHEHVLEHVAMADSIDFHVWDWDRGKKHDSLGQVTLDSSQIFPNGFCGTVPLYNCGKNKQATLTLNIQVLPPVAAPKAIPTAPGHDKFKAFVKIAHAHGLRSADIGGTSDPYVVCQVIGKAERFKTRPVMKTLNPVWHEEGEMNDIEKGDTLEFSIFDFDKVKLPGHSHDDFLGSVVLQSEDFLPNGFEGQLDLSGQGATGTIKVAVELVAEGGVHPQVEALQMQSAPAPAAAKSIEHVAQVELQKQRGEQEAWGEAQLISPVALPKKSGPDRVKLDIKILSAAGLRAADSMIQGGKSDPYCKCQIAGMPDSAFQTDVVKKTLTPTWNHSQVLSLSPSDSLDFQVYDWDRGKKADSLGHVTLEPSQFLPDGFQGTVDLLDAGKKKHATLNLCITVVGGSPGVGAEKTAQEAAPAAGPPPPPISDAGKKLVVVDDEDVGAKAVRRSDDMQVEGMRAETPNEGDGPVRMGTVRNRAMGPEYSDMRHSHMLMTSEDQRAEILQHPSMAKLDIQIIGATGLRAADGMMAGGKSDPYCACQITGKPDSAFQTEIIKKTLAPAWNHSKVLDRVELTDSLDFHVYDWDRGRKSDSLGYVTLKPSQFLPDGFAGEVELLEAGKNKKAMLNLKIEVLSIVGAAAAPPATPPPEAGEKPAAAPVEQVMERVAPEEVAAKAVVTEEAAAPAKAAAAPAEVVASPLEAAAPAPAEATAAPVEAKVAPETTAPPQSPGAPGGTTGTRIGISIAKATGLRSADWGGKSDPYCTCQVKDKPETFFKTEVLMKTLVPNWNHPEVVHTVDANDSLEFHVFDWDKGKKEGDKLGWAVLEPDQFMRHGFAGPLPLMDAGKKKNAMLEVKVRLLPPEGPSPAEVAERQRAEEEMRQKAEEEARQWEESQKAAQAAKEEAAAAAAPAPAPEEAPAPAPPPTPPPKPEAAEAGDTVAESSAKAARPEVKEAAAAVVEDKSPAPKEERAVPEQSEAKAAVPEVAMLQQESMPVEPASREQEARPALETPSKVSLSIKIVNAADLRAADYGGKSDPYCTCQIAGKPETLFKTPTIKKTVNPSWNHEQVLHDVALTDSLDFHVYDWDRGTSDDSLGHVTVEASRWLRGFAGKLELADAGKKRHATLALQIKVLTPLKPVADEPAPEATPPPPPAAPAAEKSVGNADAESSSKAVLPSLAEAEPEDSLDLFFDAPYDEINKEEFKGGVKNGLKSLGCSDEHLDKVTVDLRPGSTVASLRGPASAVAAVKVCELSNLNVMGYQAFKTSGDLEAHKAKAAPVEQVMERAAPEEAATKPVVADEAAAAPAKAAAAPAEVAAAPAEAAAPPAEAVAAPVEAMAAPETRAPLESPAAPGGTTDVKIGISIVKATGLRSADWGGKSDPYCTCQIKDKPETFFKTEVLMKTLVPNWNHPEVVHTVNATDSLEFHVFDWDKGKKEGDKLGWAILAPDQFMRDGFAGAVPLMDAGKKKNAMLEVKIRVLAPEGPSPAELAEKQRLEEEMRQKASEKAARAAEEAAKEKERQEQEAKRLAEEQEAKRLQELKAQEEAAEAKRQAEAAKEAAPPPIEEAAAPPAEEAAAAPAEEAAAAPVEEAAAAPAEEVAAVPVEEAAAAPTEAVAEAAAAPEVDIEAQKAEEQAKKEEEAKKAALAEEAAREKERQEQEAKRLAEEQEAKRLQELKAKEEAEQAAAEAKRREQAEKEREAREEAERKAKAAEEEERRQREASAATAAAASAAAAVSGPVRLKIMISGATGLRSADMGGKSDPYCECQITGRPATKFETPVIKKTLEPTWNHEQVLEDVAATESLYFHVYDWDNGRKPDSLGHITLDPSQFLPAGFDGSVELADAGKKKHAMLRLSIQVLPAAAAAAPRASPSGPAKFRARVKIVKAEKLRAADTGLMGGKSDPYVVCKVPNRPGQDFKTSTKTKNLNPTWNETTDFTDLEMGDDMDFEVFDYDKVGDDDFLGKFTLSSRDYMPTGFNGTVNLTGQKAKGTLTVEVDVARI